MIPTRIGQRSPGGYFVGINRIRNDCYAVIISPNYTQTQVKAKTSNTFTINTQSVNDGLSNTLVMDSDEHPAAQYCLGLVVDKCNDYYLPSIAELELSYRNLKPGTELNYIRPNGKILHNASEIQLGLVPTRIEYTTATPTQTLVTAFCAGNSEALSEKCYFSSTETLSNTSYLLVQNFSHGNHYWGGKTCMYHVRAVRRILITD